MHSHTHVFPPHIPGADTYDVFNELGLSKEVEQVSKEWLKKLYQDHMVHIEQECIKNLQELLLERSDLFVQLNDADIFDRVDQELKVSVRV